MVVVMNRGLPALYLVPVMPHRTPPLLTTDVVVRGKLHHRGRTSSLATNVHWLLRCGTKRKKKGK